MLKSFTSIMDRSEHIVIVQKSRFLSFAFPVFSKSDVVQILDEFRKKYNDATHICYAYTVTDNGVQEKYSDDGEPTGTAGYPICAVIKKRNLTNVLVIVVRYFGKIKLGASGLTRTYSSCASSVLDLATEYQYNLCYNISFEFESNDYYKYIPIFTDKAIVRRKTEEFIGDICKIEIAVDEEQYQKMVSLIKAITPKL